MTVFHCKMCGGAMDVRPDAFAARCGHCGTQQTLPKLDTQRRENLYDCAGHFLRCGDFDKADAVCRRILSEEPADAEAHWLLALCRYGVVYAEDPVLYRWVPMLRRTRPVPFPDDPDYQCALQYAAAGQRPLYESAAKAIHEAQEKIFALAREQVLFDVYLCCMEADASGRRTQDLMLANHLYDQLKRDGLRVFFEHVTLSDRLLGDFEPYRFAALNTASAMVVLGTKPEHFRALPVRDAWSRFLALADAGAPKRLLPVYRDMDRYELPEAFSPVRAWDMNEINFAQELIREIRAPLPAPVVRMPSGTAGSPELSVHSAPPAASVFSETSVPHTVPALSGLPETPVPPVSAVPPVSPALRKTPVLSVPAVQPASSVLPETPIPSMKKSVFAGQEPLLASGTAGEAAAAPETVREAAFAPGPAQEAGGMPYGASPSGQPAKQVLLSAEAASLLRRALLFLEDGNWQGADEYCEKVLDLEPECAQGYVGKLMAELHASRPEQLGDYKWPLDGLDNYRKAVRFADKKLRAQLETYLEQTRRRIPEHYARAGQIMSGVHVDRYRDALRILEKIPDYKNAKELIEFCKKKIAAGNEEDDVGGCFALGCVVALILLFLFMVVGIASVISTVS